MGYFKKKGGGGGGEKKFEANRLQGLHATLTLCHTHEHTHTQAHKGKLLKGLKDHLNSREQTIERSHARKLTTR